ncbi:MAG: ribonuclease P protein component [bacterium]
MLSRKYKLKKDNDFKAIFEKGKYRQKDFIRIRFSENDLEISRFGFMIGLKISKKAVKRNKIRRQMEEIIHSELNQIKSGFDIIILPNPEIAEKEYNDIQECLIGLLKESQIII